MADLVLECETCHGQRFKQDVLDVRYEGKNINDILDMTVSEAIEFFTNHKQTSVVNRLQPLEDVGCNGVDVDELHFQKKLRNRANRKRRI